MAARVGVVLESETGRDKPEIGADAPPGVSSDVLAPIAPDAVKAMVKSLRAGKTGGSGTCARYDEIAAKPSTLPERRVSSRLEFRAGYVTAANRARSDAAQTASDSSESSAIRRAG